MSEIARHFSRENLAKESFISLQTRNRYNPNLTSKWSQAISDLVNAISMLAIILTGSALITEREHGTMEHLLVMPVTPFEIMVSKIWAMTAVVLLAVTVSVYFVVRQWLEIPIAGSVPLFLVGVAFALFAINSLGIFLPLIAVNCAVMGGSLFMQQRAYSNIGEVFCFSIGSGIGWLLAIVGIAAIREKLRYSHVPPALRGVGITFIITGLMGMAFMAFMGIKL